jgi:hypothetical protein
MKKIISAIVIAGALAQAAIAMGPTGDMTRRHFYKDQEWIWHSNENQPKAKVSKDSTQYVGVVHVWTLAFTLPTHPPYLAFTLPTHPPYLAFTLPTHPPYLAFTLPTHPPYLAFTLPTHPPDSL